MTEDLDLELEACAWSNQHEKATGSSQTASRLSAANLDGDLRMASCCINDYSHRQRLNWNEVSDAQEGS